MASCPRSEAINLVNTFIYSNQKVRLHFVFTWKKQQYAIIDLLQCYVNFPALCLNIPKEIQAIWISCRTHWYTILMINITNLPPVNLYWQLLSESLKSSLSRNLPHDYSVVFLIVIFYMNIKFGLQLAFLASFHLPSRCWGRRPIVLTLSLATEESPICQNVNKFALVSFQQITYIWVGQVWYFSEKSCFYF